MSPCWQIGEIAHWSNSKQTDRSKLNTLVNLNGRACDSWKLCYDIPRICLSSKQTDRSKLKPLVNLNGQACDSWKLCYDIPRAKHGIFLKLS